MGSASPFAGRVAVVTGGAGGIGRALADELARRGARVVLTDLDGERARAAAAAVGDQARAATLDVTDAAAFERCVAEVAAREGRIDYLFNNAGIGITGEVRDMPPEAWERIIDVNLRGVIHGIQAVYPRMIDQGSGHIANTACVAGLVPFPMTAAYCATKHAIVALSTALRSEARDLGVRVSVVCPGTVATGMFDAIDYIRVDKQALMAGIQRALVPPERCARAILRGVERDRAIITVNFHARAAWWLYRLMPGAFLGLTGRFYRRTRERLRLP